MGDLLGTVPFLRRRALCLIAALAVAWTGLSAVQPADAVDADDEGDDVVLLAAGDIAGCGHAGDTATAAVVAATEGAVATLGDNVYNSGTGRQFANCYDPTWGRFKWRTHPSVGNHEYRTPRAAGYFNYFAEKAGPRGKGWYSYDLGSWHVIVLNSNCSKVGCGKGSEQEQWLRADLAAHAHQCTLAYWHHPRFSSDDRHGNWWSTGSFWEALYEHGAELVLAGHAHVYERFAPQTPAGTLDTEFGIRQFVVGTGGAGHYGFRGVKPNSEVRRANTHGVLKLNLRPGGYDWRFLPTAGQTFTDSGTSACHGARPATGEAPPSTTTTTGPAVAPPVTPPTVPAVTSTSAPRTTGQAVTSPTTSLLQPPTSVTTKDPTPPTSVTTKAPSPSSTTSTTKSPAVSSPPTTRPPATSTTTTTRRPRPAEASTTTTSTRSPPPSTTPTTRRSRTSPTTQNPYYG